MSAMLLYQFCINPTELYTVINCSIRLEAKMPTVNAYEYDDDPMRRLELDKCRILTVAQAAKLLTLSQAMVYKLVQRGELTGVRFGAAVRIRSTDLEKYILSCTTVREC